MSSINYGRQTLQLLKYHEYKHPADGPFDFEPVAGLRLDVSPLKGFFYNSSIKSAENL